MENSEFETLYCKYKVYESLYFSGVSIKLLKFKKQFRFISAAGLYYIAEVIEEYTVMTCRIIRILILVIYMRFVCYI